MRGYMADEMPLEIKDFDSIKPDTLIYDIVYNPIETILLKEAKRRGLKTIEGLDMLVFQAQRAIEIWTGKSPDANVMKTAALRELS